MNRWIAVMTVLVIVAFPAAAQLQYFGYVSGDDLPAVAANKSYVNFTHTVSDTPQDYTFLDKVNTINSRGLKVTINMNAIFWVAAGGTYLRGDWQQRWIDWKAFNASILTPDKMLGFALYDETLTHGASLADVETVAEYIKSDPGLSWLKIIWIETPCKVAYDNCGEYPFNNAFANAPSNIPAIDWIGFDLYYTHPATDPSLSTARTMMKAKYPGKKWIYLIDGFWSPTHATNFYPNGTTYMAQIADEWYAVANADPDAVLLGVFIWPDFLANGTLNLGSVHLGDDVLREHSSIGRTITGKHRGPLAGTFSINAGGTMSGWVCDRGQAIGDANPLIDIMIDGGMWTGIFTPYGGGGSWGDPQCGTEMAFGFTITLPAWSKGKSVTVVGSGQNPGTVPSSCPQTPACVW